MFREGPIVLANIQNFFEFLLNNKTVSKFKMKQQLEENMRMFNIQ